MSEEQRATPKQQSPFDGALAYLAEVANTYSQTLDKVALGPFVQHINGCIQVISEERTKLTAEIAKLTDALATPAPAAPKAGKGA